MGFGAAFAGSWFNAIGAMADFVVCETGEMNFDGRYQQTFVGQRYDRQTSGDLLHRRRETQLTWQKITTGGRLQQGALAVLKSSQLNATIAQVLDERDPRAVRLAVILAALKAARARLPREACAEKLTAAVAGASTLVKVSLLEQLAAIGGKQALDTVAAAARSDDDAMQDAATRLLGGWLAPTQRRIRIKTRHANDPAILSPIPVFHTVALEA